jgi:hypothetical protein
MDIKGIYTATVAMSRQRQLGVGVLGIGFLLAQAYSQNVRIGYVAHFDEEVWFRKGAQRPLERLEPIYAGDKIVLRKPPGSKRTFKETLVLHFSNTDKPRPYVCDEKTACDQMLDLSDGLKKSPSLPDRIAKLVEGIQTLFLASPKVYEVTAANSADSYLLESIVEYDGKSLGLGRCFAKRNPGKYPLQLSPLATNGLVDKGRVPVRITYDYSNSQSVAPVRGLPGGLYLVQTMDSVSGVLMPATEDHNAAWVYVVDTQVKRGTPEGCRESPSPLRRLDSGRGFGYRSFLSQSRTTLCGETRCGALDEK